ncbi:fibronectin type III domain protein, partial [Dictyocaulus viviparus]
MISGRKFFKYSGLIVSGSRISVRCIARGKPEPQLSYALTDVGVKPEEIEISARCIARGKPEPQLSYALTDVGVKPEEIEDFWQPLGVNRERESVVGNIEFSILSSKTLHCRAKNVAGSNYSSLTFHVKKPGDSPQDIQVLSIDARDVIIAWKPPKHPNMKIKSYELLLNEDVDENEEYWQKYVTTPSEDSILTRSFYCEKEVHQHIPFKAQLTSNIDSYNESSHVIRLSEWQHFMIHRSTVATNFNQISNVESYQSLSLPTDQLKPSYIYFVRVRAVNDAGAGPLSEAIYFTTPNGGPENPPTEVSVDINEANIAVVRWKKPNSTREILNYVIYFTRDLGISNEDFHDWQMVEVPATQTKIQVVSRRGSSRKWKSKFCKRVSFGRSRKKNGGVGEDRSV